MKTNLSPAERNTLRMADLTFAALAGAHVQSPAKTRVGLTFDASETATILAALRMFQREYDDCESAAIALDFPLHFDIDHADDTGTTITPEPLGTDDIDDLCERINCA